MPTTYIGRRDRHVGGAAVMRRDEKGGISALPFRWDLVNHSPTGFEWGYGGSGPAQLALALLVDATGDEQWSLTHYQSFKWEVVSSLPWEWELHQETVRAWCEKEKAKAQDHAL